MLPLRHEFIRFGGSWSQRQVFNVTMIQAAVKANNGAVATGLVAEMMVYIPLYTYSKAVRLFNILLWVGEG